MDIRTDRLLVEMATEVHNQPDKAVRRIAEYARSAVDGDDSGIMLAKPKGRVETPAGTSDRVTRAHSLQAEMDEGPCLDAVRTDIGSYLVDDVAIDARWPAWGPRVADLGYRSTMSVRLENDGRRFGSLNVYDARVGAFDRADLEVLELLALHASVAYANAEQNVSLRAALDSRTIIGQAQGVLMQAYDLDPETAFAFLRRRSQDENIRLVEVAKQVLDDRSQLGRPLTQEPPS